jgi:replication-associated recombination protein RarA
LIEEDERMSDVLMDIMKDKVDKVVRTATAEATAKTTLATMKNLVESLMRNSGMDVRQAMDTLEIPEDMRDEVKALVGEDGD